MCKKFQLITFLFLFYIIANAQVSIQWQKCLGGNGQEFANSIQQTTDGGYILTGFTDSDDGEITGNNGVRDVLIVKLDNYGDIEWHKCLGGSLNEIAYSILQTTDGGYILAGYTESDDGDVIGNHGGNGDVWVVKLDCFGNVEWQKCLGGSSFEVANAIQQTTDGGYILAGYTQSNDGDVFGNNGEVDLWVVKLYNFGDIEWQRCYGGSSWDYANSIQQIDDGSYIVAGGTYSEDGDVLNDNEGDFNVDAWVLKLDVFGNIEWQNCFGGSSGENARSIQHLTEGGYLFVGSTESNDGDFTDNHGSMDAYVAKLNDTGDVEWHKCIGGIYYDHADSFDQTLDGGCVLAGTTETNGYDVWIIKVNSIGEIEWQKCFGGSNRESAYSIQQISDENYIVAGQARSNDGDVSEYNGGISDMWVVKLNEPNISGYVFNDENLNGTNDDTEQPVAGQLIKLEPGPCYTFTNNEGRYYFRADVGDYTVSYLPVNYWYATTNSEIQFAVEQTYDVIDNLIFGITSRVNTPDIATYLIGTTTRAGFETNYFLNYCNLGTVTTSGTLNFEYDPLLIFLSSTVIPDSHVGNQISWNYNPIGSGVQRSIQLDFLIPGVENIGDTLISKSWITPLTPDSCVVNNFDSINQEIIGSYDPNAKTVNPIGYFEEGYVLHGQKLNYTICFQNTGNDTAFTIILRDTLDLTKMDIETFFVEANSHPVEWQLKNSNVMEFTFNNIRLPDSIVNEPESHGFIRFSISPKSGLTDYSVVNNTAYIYFDYNPPIVTNTTKNTYVSTIPGLVQVLSSSELITSFYPNPVKDELNFSFTEDGLKIIRITNIIGQTVFQTSTDKNQLEINFSMFDKGLYFICIMCNNKESFAKIIKE